MPNKFSVIIPARNAEKTLGFCLKAVFESLSVPDEVIVVDDASGDRTSEIAKQFDCHLLRVRLSKGPMQPRFAGAAIALCPVMVFIDADVCVKPDTFSRLLNHFEHPEITAVTGILSRSARGENFYSAYKNEYMNFIFKKQPAVSSFLYGSLWAVRKDEMPVFEPITEPFGSLVSDSEMGIRLSIEGGRLLLDHSLKVEHLKRYTFSGLLKNDFVIPFMFSLLFLKFGRSESLLRVKGFSHARAGQVVAAAASFIFILFSLAGFTLTGFMALSLVLAYWSSFLFGLIKKRGVLFSLGTALLLPLDQAVAFLGMVCGFVYGWLRPSPPDTFSPLPRETVEVSS